MNQTRPSFLQRPSFGGGEESTARTAARTQASLSTWLLAGGVSSPGEQDFSISHLVPSCPVAEAKFLLSAAEEWGLPSSAKLLHGAQALPRMTVFPRFPRQWFHARRGEQRGPRTPPPTTHSAPRAGMFREARHQPEPKRPGSNSFHSRHLQPTVGSLNLSALKNNEGRLW